MSYRIQSGDTLSALAVRFGTTVDALAKANNIANVDLIYTGNTLQIPGQTGDSFEPGRRRRAAAASAAPGGSRSARSPRASGANASRLASVARQTGQRMNSQGWCAKGVADSLAAAGFGGIPAPAVRVHVRRRAGPRSALQGSQPHRRPDPPAPAGRGRRQRRYNSPTNPHGHITVTLGGGMESSDHVQSLLLIGTQRVFIPV